MENAKKKKIFFREIDLVFDFSSLFLKKTFPAHCAQKNIP